MARKQVYVDIDEVGEIVKVLLIDIMLFVRLWIKKEKTTVPRQEIFKIMKVKGKSDEQIDHALRTLISLKYIRKAETMSNKTSFVLLRTDIPES